MSKTLKDRHQNVTGPPLHVEGNPKYDLQVVAEHISQPIDNQQKLAAQDWRAVAHVLVNRAKKYALSCSKADAANMHHMIQSAGIAYDKAYKGADGDQRGPAHVLIQLFGASGVGEAMARNLQRMIPSQRTITVTPIDSTDEPTPTKTPK